jgi:hypothetical protein
LLLAIILTTLRGALHCALDSIALAATTSTAMLASLELPLAMHYYHVGAGDIDLNIVLQDHHLVIATKKVDEFPPTGPGRRVSIHETPITNLAARITTRPPKKGTWILIVLLGMAFVY